MPASASAVASTLEESLTFTLNRVAATPSLEAMLPRPPRATMQASTFTGSTSAGSAAPADVAWAAGAAGRPPLREAFAAALWSASR